MLTTALNYPPTALIYCILNWKTLVTKSLMYPPMCGCLQIWCFLCVCVSQSVYLSVWIIPCFHVCICERLYVHMCGRMSVWMYIFQRACPWRFRSLFMVTCFYRRAVHDSGSGWLWFWVYGFSLDIQFLATNKICWTLEFIAGQRQKGTHITQFVDVKFSTSLYHKGMHKLLSAMDKIM